MTQVMRYHRHPSEPIGVEGFWIRKDGSDWYGAFTRGGNGSGGAYDWDGMVLIPDCSISVTERSALGAISYDAAISLSTHFARSSSQADTLKAKEAFVDTFQFAYAVKGYNGGANIGDGLLGMINPNLDARDPVILGIRGSSGHAVVCDGYGYVSSTLYHHLNMGWSGVYDAWYNLPNIDTNRIYSSIYKCVYNIRPEGSGGGEVVSGRVLAPTGQPISNPIVHALPIDQDLSISAESDNKGIYAFDDLAPGKTYVIDVDAEGYKFEPRIVTTGRSSDNAAVSGNIWGVDLVGRFAGDALIGHWKLDEAHGEIAGDSAGVNDGILHGEAMWEPLVGILDGAVSCDENDHIRIPNESTFDMVEQITVACWINIKDIDKDWQTIIAKGDSAWRLSTHRSEARMHFAVTGPPQHMAVNSSSELSTGAWHHVCGTYDGANIRIYIDGVEDSAEPAPYSGGITTNNFDVYIGDNAEKPNRHWRGMIDDVRIYNYALDQGEVGKLITRC